MNARGLHILRVPNAITLCAYVRLHSQQWIEFQYMTNRTSVPKSPPPPTYGNIENIKSETNLYTK